jgi:hypothetical protein
MRLVNCRCLQPLDDRELRDAATNSSRYRPAW